jgi:hypothetical protein
MAVFFSFEHPKPYAHVIRRRMADMPTHTSIEEHIIHIIHTDTHHYEEDPNPEGRRRNGRRHGQRKPKRLRPKQDQASATARQTMVRINITNQ